MESNVSRGIDSLREAVLRDCKKGQNCFNENGCDHEFHRSVPEDDIKMLKYSKTKCIHLSKCGHKYCDKYKWVIERAAHYAEKIGKTKEEVIAAWESERSYWYMNYYQDCNQPLINDASTLMYEQWVEQLNERFGNMDRWAFVCPSCGHVQTVSDFKEIGVDYFLAASNCIGRYSNDKGGCDWTLGGFFRLHKTSVIKDGKAYPVFEMAPISLL